MIDLKDYRINPTKYHKGAADKGAHIDRAAFDTLDTMMKQTLTSIEALRTQRNELTTQIQQASKDQPDQITTLKDQVKQIKTELETLEYDYDAMYGDFWLLMAKIPSPAFDDVPVGASDAENLVMYTVWTKPTFAFTPKHHREILEAKWYLDTVRATKLSGSRFTMLKGQAVLLEFALIQWVLHKLVGKWFIPAMPPQLVKEQAMYATGFFPNDKNNVYTVNPKAPHTQELREEDDLYLIGTAEVPLVAQHSDEVLEADILPLRYVGYSSCYRREAGTYGKDTKGLIRLHQFEKVEMVTFVKPEDSAAEHELLVSIEEEIFTDLGLHFHKLHICTGDLWAPAARKYDLEAWFPAQEAYREVTSTSNTTDFQTRRANIKYKDGQTRDFVHSLNGTAIAMSRCIACIIETYQTAEGDVIIPEVLRPFMGGVERI